jgi:hypothetical protein
MPEQSERRPRTRDGTPPLASGGTGDVDRALYEVAALVRESDRLRGRGADEVELERNRLALERVRWRLANAVRRSAVDEGPQAA